MWRRAITTMFTGIIQHVGTVVATRATGAGRELTVELGPLAEGLAVGDSVAVAGACLTASAVRGRNAAFDVGAETLARTTLGALAAGAKVNLERPVSAGSALDGHIVLGHVDGVAEVRAVRTAPQHVMQFAAGGEITALMVEKGSVCIDGVSLTLVDVSKIGFGAALIPETLARTALGGLRSGSKVNVETDIIGKYVLKYVAAIAGEGGLTMDKLRGAGFI
jgi:riboflavin synthase